MIFENDWSGVEEYLTDEQIVKIVAIERVFDKWGMKDHVEHRQYLFTTADNFRYDVASVIFAYYRSQMIGLLGKLGIKVKEDAETIYILALLEGLINFMLEEDREEYDEHLASIDGDKFEFIMSILFEHFQHFVTEETPFFEVVEEIEQETVSFILDKDLNINEIDTFLKTNEKMMKLVHYVKEEPSLYVKSFLLEMGDNIDLNTVWKELRSHVIKEDVEKQVIDVFFILSFANDTSILIEDYIKVIENDIKEKSETRLKLIKLISKTS